MAARAKTDILLGYGPETKATVETAAAEGVAACHFADRQGAADKLTEILQPGDIVLLKGSHSMQVSGIIDLVFKK
jgi:UDP-N-acetylmuramoyl-tripeptide--D-alanyl-D-alanine ligase